MRYLLAVVVMLSFIGCGADKEPEPQISVSEPEVVIQEKIVYKDKIIYQEKECPSSELKTIGAVEFVQVVDVGVAKEARIDTGATTTSIDAQDIVQFERDGKNWVKFKFADKEIEKKMKGIVNIKKHGAKDDKRPSVMIRLALGDITRNVKVTLADRSKFRYPILIGRNFLKDVFIVDVSKKTEQTPQFKVSN